MIYFMEPLIGSADEARRVQFHQFLSGQDLCRGITGGTCHGGATSHWFTLRTHPAVDSSMMQSMVPNRRLAFGPLGWTWEKCPTNLEMLRTWMWLCLSIPFLAFLTLLASIWWRTPRQWAGGHHVPHASLLGRRWESGHWYGCIMVYYPGMGVSNHRELPILIGRPLISG